MRHKLTLATFVICSVVALVLVAFVLHGSTLGVLNPQGIIAAQEGALMAHALLLMFIIVIPVFVLTVLIAWRYRDGGSAVYSPDWEHSKLEELIWWAVPLEIILVLGALTWSSTHQLDPYRPLTSDTPALTVQVVSLDWKWLFIYPSLGIATVNYLAIPEQTPINFQLTSDAPMNAFWIPQLGGQEMTMPGMTTQLHLMASGPGAYVGLSSNYSGEGFSGMQFKVDSMTESNFSQWAATLKNATNTLTYDSYRALAAPSQNNPPALYALGDPGLYTKIIMQFMEPPSATSTAAMQMR